MNDIFVGVVSHKEIKKISEDGYYPVFVGENSEKLKEVYKGTAYTDRGEYSIYELNPQFSELTAQFWIYKNVSNVDIKGLVHYRRFLIGSNGNILNKDEISNTLTNYQLILSKRVYSKDSVINTYRRFHNVHDLEFVREVIIEMYPEYADAFDETMKKHSYHSLNILFAKSSIFDEYSKWLFTILFEVQKRIKISDDPYQRRVLGFLSERLLDVWILKNKLSYKEFPVNFLEQKSMGKYLDSVKQVIYSLIFQKK